MTDAGAQKKCQSCARLNEASMSFCLDCGKKLPDVRLQTKFSQVPGPLTAQTCGNCGRTDDLSSRFCIFCGHEFSVATAAHKISTGKFAWSSSIAVAYFAVAGVLAGVAAASGIPSSWLGEFVVRMNCPHHGLVIYAQALTQPVQVLIEDESGRSFTMGRLSSDGSFSLPDLAPGNYRVIFSHDGHRDGYKEVRIDSDKSTILGFPQRIQLIGSSKDAVVSIS